MSRTSLTLPLERPVGSNRWAVELRPLEAGDGAALLEIFAGLGRHSRELRFLAPKPRLTAGDLRQLTAVDHHDHVAVLAVSARHGRPVGVARFVREPGRPESADVAVAVVDDWQDRGIGTLLTAALVERAQEVGVRRFTLMMRQDNEGAVRLMHRTRGEIHRLAMDGEHAEFAVTLDDPAPGPRLRQTVKRWYR